MRVGASLLVLVLAAACGSADSGARIERYGISLAVPSGWSGEISRGKVRIARQDVSVVLYEYEPAAHERAEAAGFFTDGCFELVATDFEAAAVDREYTRAAVLGGRFFSLFVAADSPPTAHDLAELNAALGSLRVEPGDYFPGTVSPAVFSLRSGWHTGAGAPAERTPQGEYVQSWAATTRYLDEANAVPRQTLEALPPAGIVIVVALSRDARLGKSGRVLDVPPYALGRFVRQDNWEGQVRQLPRFSLATAYGDRYFVDLDVYFGRPDPSDAMVAEADAMLTGLRFPDWGPWELEPG